jgi:hypothetical protein
MRYLTYFCLTLSLVACDQSEAPKAKPATPKQTVVTTQTLAPLVSTIEKSKTIKPKCKGDDCPNIEIEIDRFNDDKELSTLIERELVNMTASLSDDKKVYANLTELSQDFWQKSESRWSIFLHCKILRQKDNIIVLELGNESYLGGAHEIGYTKYLNIDRKTHQVIPLTQLFIAGKEAAFWAKIQAQHQTWIKDNELNDEHSIATWPFIHTDNVALTDKGLTVKYQNYDLAPYAFGQLEFSVSYEQLNGIINPQFL